MGTIARSTRQKSFFDPIKKVELNYGVEKSKVAPRAVNILKENRQAFGIMVSKTYSLEEAFSYPITSVPLSGAIPEGTLRQGEKVSFRNFHISSAEASHSHIPKNCSWYIDEMSTVRSTKPGKTYLEWFRRFERFILPPIEAEPVAAGIINDTYRDDSLKRGTRKERGESDVKVLIEGFEQHMLQGTKWQEVLTRGDNKEELINLILRYFQSENVLERL